MSRMIAGLLGIDEREFAKIIERLETVTLQPGVDVRLSAEIITQSRQKARDFGYEPSETTAKELYYGLLARAEKDDLSLRDKIGVKENAKLIQATEIIAKTAEKLLKKERTIAMQPAAVKRVLKAVPPKKTIKALKYRSIDSVLKRENPLLLYALAKRLEEKSWHTQIAARLKRLEVREATEQSIKILYIPKNWESKINNIPFENVVQTVPEIGSVLLLPTIPINHKGAVLLTLSLVLQAGQRMSIESLPFRAKSLTVGIENLIPEIAVGFVEQFQPVHGLKPSWHAVYQLIVEQGKHQLPDFDFILGDLQWESTEIKLASLVPEMDLWVNSHFLGYNTYPLPVSMHIIDVAASLVLEREFGEHIVSHMRASLWNELQLRYLKQENLEKSIIKQLSIAQGLVL